MLIHSFYKLMVCTYKKKIFQQICIVVLTKTIVVSRAACTSLHAADAGAQTIK